MNVLDPIGRFLDFLDKRAVFRRVAFVTVLAGTVNITHWAMMFADRWLETDKPGSELAMVLAAITAPFTVLQGAVIRYYLEHRTNSGA